MASMITIDIKTIVTKTYKRQHFPRVFTEHSDSIDYIVNLCRIHEVGEVETHKSRSVDQNNK